MVRPQDKPNPLHVLIVSPYRHFEAISGATVRARKICEHLGSRPDIRLTLAAPFKLVDAGDYLPYALSGSLFHRLLQMVYFNWLVHKIHPDVVIFEGPLSFPTFGRFKSVQLIHDVKFASPFGRRARHVAKVFYAISVWFAGGVMTVSRSEAAEIAKLFSYVRNLIVSYNGIGDAWLVPPPVQPEPRYDIVYVSNYAAHKAHTDLLRATMDCDYKIAFVGRNFGDEAKVRALAAQSKCRVDFLSDLSEADLIGVYDASKLMVFPSQREGFGIPFLEARSRGLPVIVNDIAVFRELAALLGGTTVNCSDSAALSAAISSALTNPERNFLAADVVEQFRWSVVTDTMVKRLREVFPDMGRH